MAAYPPIVERWRTLVEQHFPPEEVDKWLYTINGESGGNPKAVGDGGAAIGLFQDQHISPDSTIEQMFESARRLYDGDKRAGGTGFGDWGEGRLYQGKPFGALGNNPYQGGPSNGRVLASSGVKPVMAAPAVPTTTAKKKPSLGGYLQSIGTAAQKTVAANKIKTSPKATYSGYQATGDFAADVGGYSGDSTLAWDALDKYQGQAGFATQVDEKQGVVFKITDEVDIDGNPLTILDPEGTRLLQAALSKDRALDRLFAGKEAGVYGNGGSAALAYMNSEIAKGDEATREYEDYNARIGKIIALDNVPIQQAATLASTLASINTAAASQKKTYGSSMGLTGRPKPTDTAPFAAAIKSTLPAQAPKPYNIDPGAFQTAPEQIKVPTRKPEEILQSYGIGQPITAPFPNAGVPATIGTATNITTMPSQHPNSTYGGPAIDKAMIDRLMQEVRFPRK